MKIGKIILSICSVLLAGLLTYVSYRMKVAMPTEKEATLGLIVLIPLLIVFFGFMISLLYTGIYNAVKGLFSLSLTGRIISIVVLVISVALLGFDIYLGINVFKAL